MKQQKRIVHQFGESSLCDFITLHLNFLGLLTDSLGTSCRKKTIYRSSPHQLIAMGFGRWKAAGVCHRKREPETRLPRDYKNHHRTIGHLWLLSFANVMSRWWSLKNPDSSMLLKKGQVNWSSASQTSRFQLCSVDSAQLTNLCNKNRVSTILSVLGNVLDFSISKHQPQRPVLPGSNFLRAALDPMAANV